MVSLLNCDTRLSNPTDIVLQERSKDKTRAFETKFMLRKFLPPARRTAPTLWVRIAFLPTSHELVPWVFEIELSRNNAIGARSKRPCRTAGRRSSTSSKELPTAILNALGYVQPATPHSAYLRQSRTRSNFRFSCTLSCIPPLARTIIQLEFVRLATGNHLLATPLPRYVGVSCFHALSCLYRFVAYRGLALDESIFTIATSLVAVWLGSRNVFLVIVFPFEPSIQHSPSNSLLHRTCTA